MNTKRFHQRVRLLRRRWFLWPALAAVCAPAVLGAPPLEAIPAPLYSFDLQSPHVQANFFDARDVLMLDHPDPVVVVFGANLGMMSALDELDALSGPGSQMAVGDSFVILFSVDRVTTGNEPPDLLLASMGVPFNVKDQASRGQAAGDQFMSLDIFTLPEGGTLRGGRATNAVLSRNNYDEGGTDFESAPPTSAGDPPAPAPEDNVNATGEVPAAKLGGRAQPVHVYFSVTRGSPSLPALSGSEPPSGANVFYNADPNRNGLTEVYASFEQFGLNQFDEIDAIAVFDRNVNGIFDMGDFVLFSLDADSPSLDTIPGASTIAAAADVFIVTADDPPILFAPASQFGMGAPGDNIDALGIHQCADGFNCAIRHGIRVWGDVNCDGVVDLFDIDAFVLVLTSANHVPPFDEFYEMYPMCQPLAADTNQDGVVNLFDIDPFVTLILGP